MVMFGTLVEWIDITTKFDSKCIVCSKKLGVGESVKWKKGEGVKCPTECETEKKPVISEKEWNDFKKYTYKELLSITNCQKCGKSLKHVDSWIDNDRKTCEKCHE